MCNCINEAKDELAKQHNQNGLDAYVQVRTYVEFYVKPYVLAVADRHDLRKGKEVRLSRAGRYSTMKYNYCPLCGQRLEGS